MLLKENNKNYTILENLYDKELFNYFINNFPNFNRTVVLFGNSLIYKINTIKKIDNYLNSLNISTEMIILDNNVSIDKTNRPEYLRISKLSQDPYIR